MKHTQPEPLLSRELLSFVRDVGPTPEVFIQRFGEQEFHVLRKHRVLVVDEGRVRLSRRCLSPDGQYFAWGQMQIRLDCDEVRLVRYGTEGSPIFNDEV